MNHGSLRAALTDLDALRTVRARFLTFFFLPVEQRVGQWRFAGATDNLGAAIEQIGIYGTSMELGGGEGPREWMTRLVESDVLEIGTPATVWGYRTGATFQSELDAQDEDEIGEPCAVEKLPPHRLVLFAQGGAPYDDIGFAVVEAKSLGAYADRAPDTRRPATWPES